MFGPQRDFENRIAEYRSNLVGIKHLHQFKPPLTHLSKPQPNQPIDIYVTTSGGVAYDAVRCWVDANGEKATFELASKGSVWNTLEWRYVHHWHGQIAPQPSGTAVRYRIGGRVVGSDGWVFADNQARVLSEATEFAIAIDDDGVPKWARDAVIYHIFLDRFYPGDGVPWKTTDKPLWLFRWNAPRRDSEARLHPIAWMHCNLALTPLCKSRLTTVTMPQIITPLSRDSALMQN